MDAEYMPRKRRGKKRLRRGKSRYKGSALEKYNKARARKTGKKRRKPAKRRRVRSGYAFRPMSNKKARRHISKVVARAKKRRVTVFKPATHRRHSKHRCEVCGAMATHYTLAGPGRFRMKKLLCGRHLPKHHHVVSV